jgi:WD40 repeat protein
MTLKHLLLIFILLPITFWAQKPELVIPTGFRYGPNLLRTTPNGRFIMGSDDEHLILWDAKTIRQLRSYDLKIAKIHDFRISPDGRSVVIFNDKDVQCFEIETGKKMWSATFAYTHYSGVYVDNGSKIVLTCNEDGFVISAATGEKLSSIPNFGVHEAQAFNLPNNKVLLLGKETYKIYNTTTATVESSVNFDSFKKTRAVSEKFGLLFVASTGSANIQVYDLNTNKIIKTLTYPTDEPVLGTTVEGDILLARGHDPNDSKYTSSMVKSYTLPNFESKTLKMNDMGGPGDGFVGGSTALDMVYGNLGKVRKISTGQLVGEISGPLNKYGFTVTDNNSVVWQKEQVIGFESHGKYNVLDLRTGQIKMPIAFSSDDILAAEAFSADGKQFAGYFYDNTFRIYETGSGKLLKSFPLDPPTDRLFYFSASGEEFYLHIDGKFSVLNLKTGKITRQFATLDAPYYAISKDDKVVAALDGNRDGWTVAAWELATGKELMKLPHEPKGYERDFGITDDGKTVFVLDESEPSVYSTVTKSKVTTPNFTLYFGFPRGYWSGDNARIAITGDGRGVRLLDKNFIQQAEIPYTGKTINKIVFTEKNNVFFAIETDQIGIYDAANAKLLGNYFSFQNSKDWLVVTPDGRYDGTPEAFKKLYYISGTEVLPLEALFEKFYTPGLYGMLVNGISPPPVDGNINNLKKAPTVKIQYENQQRNLHVENDIPAYNTTVNTATLTISAECPSDAIAEIRLFHNGKVVGSATRNLIVEDETIEKTKSQKYEITLTEGENRLKAVAFNTQRTESLPSEIIINFSSKTAPGNGGQKGPTLHLLVVGINKYKNPKYNLNYATADATSFKAALEQSSGSIFSQTNAVFVNDEKATKEGISTELMKIKASAQAQDVFIFYYAGHGVLNDKNEFFLVPHDVTQLYGNDEGLDQKGLSAKQLQDFSKEIKAQKQLFLLDACQSAGALDAISQRGVAEEKAIAQLARATGTHWLTASGSEQFASEFAQLGHGTFTWVLLEALTGKADVGGDGKITVKELDAYLQEHVPEVTAKYKGTPQYPASYGFGNDFPVGIARH